MIDQMPALSATFHLSPADIWDLTQEELVAYLEAAKELERRMGETA